MKKNLCLNYIITNLGDWEKYKGYSFIKHIVYCKEIHPKVKGNFNEGPKLYNPEAQNPYKVSGTQQDIHLHETGCLIFNYISQTEE